MEKVAHLWYGALHPHCKPSSVPHSFFQAHTEIIQQQQVRSAKRSTSFTPTFITNPNNAVLHCTRQSNAIYSTRLHKRLSFITASFFNSKRSRPCSMYQNTFNFFSTINTSNTFFSVKKNRLIRKVNCNVIGENEMKSLFAFGRDAVKIVVVYLQAIQKMRIRLSLCPALRTD